MSSDRVKRGLVKLVQHLLRPTDYHAMYPARVESQNDEGNLDVVPDDSRLPGMTNVPIRYGIPGVTASVKTGSRVIIQFEGGNPQKPVATVWDASAVEYLIVGAEQTYIGEKSNDAKPIAREGDTVMSFLPPKMPIAGTLSGAPFVGLLTVAQPLLGIITSGASMGYAK